MNRSVSGLSQAALATNPTVDGVYLIRVEGVQHRWERKKPYYLIRFTVVAPKGSADAALAGRLYYFDKALWKLSWFLRDFGYDAELLKQDEVDERRMVGLTGHEDFDDHHPRANFSDLGRVCSGRRMGGMRVRRAERRTQ